jgi:hypothetical protein
MRRILQVAAFPFVVVPWTSSLNASTSLTTEPVRPTVSEGEVKRGCNAYGTPTSSSEKNRIKQGKNAKFLVRKVGFEPTRLAAPPPQDGASASSATSA